MLGVDQSALAKWERNARPVPIPVVLRIAEHAQPGEREYWLRHAGVDLPKIEQQVRTYKTVYSYADGDLLFVPILKGAIAAGGPLSPDKHEFDGHIAIPLKDAADCAYFTAVRVRGSSMAPRIADGDLVVIDRRKRPLEENVGHIVAASDEQGDMTIKILQRVEGIYCLMAGNPAFEPRLQPVDVSNKWAIHGRIHCWIGQPHTPKRK
jgi:SOS-response transcriptional repressor LexA